MRCQIQGQVSSFRDTRGIRTQRPAPVSDFSRPSPTSTPVGRWTERQFSSPAHVSVNSSHPHRIRCSYQVAIITNQNTSIYDQKQMISVCTPCSAFTWLIDLLLEKMTVYNQPTKILCTEHFGVTIKCKSLIKNLRIHDFTIGLHIKQNTAFMIQSLRFSFVYD